MFQKCSAFLVLLGLLAAFVLLPATALDCHTAHDAACGYIPAREEVGCGHIHSDGCFQLFTGQDGTTVEIENCLHIHCDACGYLPAQPETPCTHSCDQCLPSAEDFFVSPTEPPALFTAQIAASSGLIEYDGTYFPSLSDALMEAEFSKDPAPMFYLLDSTDTLSTGEIFEGMTPTLDLDGKEVGTLILSGNLSLTNGADYTYGSVDTIQVQSGVLSLGTPNVGTIVLDKDAPPIQADCPIPTPIAIDAPLGQVFAQSGFASISPASFRAYNSNYAVSENAFVLYCLHKEQTCTAEGCTITAACAHCPETGTLILEDDNTVSANGILTGAEYSLTVPDSSAPGNHTATLSHGGCTVSREFTVNCPHDDPTYSSDGSTITATCRYFHSSIGTITLNEDYTVTGTGIFESTVYLADVPVFEKPGEYFVTFTYGGETVSLPYTIPIDSVQLTLGESLVYTGEALTQSYTLSPAVYHTVSGHSGNTLPGTYTLTIQGESPYVGTLTADYTIAKSADYTLVSGFPTQQRMASGTSTFVEPTFIGLNGESVPGALTYDHPLPDVFTESTALNYTFTPASDCNYTGPKSGTISLTVETPVFEAENGKFVTAPNTAEYDQEDIVILRPITAVLGTARDSDPNHFRLVYGEEYPVIGTNTYKVLYSGTLDGLTFANIEVCSGEFTLTRSEAAFTQLPEALELTYTGQPQNLIKPGQSNSGPVTYSLDPNGPFTDMVQAADAGIYKVYYAIQGDAFHDPVRAQYIRAEIQKATPTLPKLTATYGQRLSEIALPAGFSWDESRQDPEVHTVGSVDDPNTCYLCYTSPDPDNIRSLVAEPITFTVLPKAVQPTAVLSQTAYHLADLPIEGAQPEVTLTDENGEGIPDFTCVYADNTSLGTASVTISPSGNYTFEPLTETFLIFERRPKLTALSASATPDALVNLLPMLDALACYQVENQYTIDGTAWVTSDDPVFLPSSDFTVKIPDPSNGKASSFSCAAQYTLPALAQGIPAGRLATPKVKREGNLLSLSLPTAAILCLSWEVEEEEPECYTIDLMKDSQGNVTLSQEEAEPGTPVTILTQPRWSSYELSTLQILTDSGKSLSPATLGSGIYSFQMPAEDVTVIVSFQPKSDNPKTADPIFPVLAASLLSTLSLLALYLFKLRRES